MLRVLACALAVPLAACAAHGEDPHMPGDPLGTFHVTAKLTNDSCQAAFLGVQDPWQFDVELSRKEGVLYWLNGDEAIPGELATDGESFSFTSDLEEPVVPARPGNPGCTVARADAASGVLSSTTDDVASFSGALSFTYSDAEGSDCSPWVGTGDGFATLPCSVSYDTAGTRTKAPTSK